MGINSRINKILQEKKVEFIDPKPEKEGRDEKDWAEGIVYVEDSRVPNELLVKIEKNYGPIPKGSYFSNNFSTYWEKLKPDYGGEVDSGTKSVSKQYKLPNINNVFKQFEKLNDQLEWLKDNEEIQEDKKLSVIFQEIRDVFNTYRTHIRNNYPEYYKSLKEDLNEGYDAYDEIAQSEFGMDYDQLGPNEQEWVQDEYDNQPSGRDVSEMSTTGGGAGSSGFSPGEGMGYATPYAFTGGKKAKEPKALKKLGYKLAK